MPLAAIVGYGVSLIPELIRGEIAPLRILRAVPNSWYAFGPAVVLGLAHQSGDHASISWLTLALAAQFLVDFVVYYVRSWLMRGASLMSQLRDSWTYGVDAGLSVTGIFFAVQLHDHWLVALAPLPLLALLAVFARERHQRLEGVLELNNAYRGTALVLGGVVEADDGYTGEHCQMVLGLALAVGAELGLGADAMRDLEFGALLHDVGKVVVPKEIINKPGKLTAEEWEIMRTHTIEGQKMLDQVGGFMSQVGLIVRSHHERWDGGGYPDGLMGEAIPVPARIVTCCDSWNAMRTNRSYRQALSYDAARNELLAHSGTQFDPHVVDAFLAVVSSSEDEAETFARIGQLTGAPRTVAAPETEAGHVAAAVPELVPSA